MTRDRLLIATPAFEPLVWMGTYASMLELDTLGMEVEAFCPTGYSVEQARLKAAKHAIETGARWLLCVDSDIVVPKDALRSMRGHGEKVVFGYYAKGSDATKTAVRLPTAESWIGHEMTKTEIFGLRDGGVEYQEVSAGGFGCVLIDMTVFDRIRRPWFKYTFEEDFKLSEDYHFCARCREAGIRMVVDTTVECGHIKPNVI